MFPGNDRPIIDTGAGSGKRRPSQPVAPLEDDLLDGAIFDTVREVRAFIEHMEFNRFRERIMRVCSYAMSTRQSAAEQAAGLHESTSRLPVRNSGQYAAGCSAPTSRP